MFLHVVVHSIKQVADTNWKGLIDHSFSDMIIACVCFETSVNCLYDMKETVTFNSKSSM